LSNATGDKDSPIRRIRKDEKDMRRQWPGKKHLASEQPVLPTQRIGENRIHSVLVALPVLMLMIGLFVYFKGESAQINGEPVLSEMVKREAQFKSISMVSGIGSDKYYLWYFFEGNAKGARVTDRQKEKLNGLEFGNELVLELAPKVAGSTTLWVYRILSEGTELVGP